VSFSRSYTFKDNGLGLIWDFCIEEMVESNTDEREWAMGFQTEVTNVLRITKFQRRYFIGQAMDFNCLSWVVQLL